MPWKQGDSAVLFNVSQSTISIVRITQQSTLAYLHMFLNEEWNALLKYACSVLSPVCVVWGEGARPWLTPMAVAPDTKLVMMHQNKRSLINIIFVFIDERKKSTACELWLTILAWRNFNKFLLNPTSLLWAVSFGVIMILGINKWRMKGSW